MIIIVPSYTNDADGVPRVRGKRNDGVSWDGLITTATMLSDDLNA